MSSLRARLAGGRSGASGVGGGGAHSGGSGLSGARLNPGRPGVVAMAVVAVVSLFVTGGWVLASRPHRLAAASVQLSSAPQPVSAGGSLMSPLATPSGAAAGAVGTGKPSVRSDASSGAGSSGGSAGDGQGGTAIVVDVVGRVRKPGVYRLTAGARVDDAVAAAGGLLAGVNLVTVNLARKLSDGEQVAIGVTVSGPGAGGVTAGAAVGDEPSSSAASGSDLVDLNSATAGQLDALPGVGPVLAQRIVDWRTQHTKFASVDQLQSVSGIGDAKFADLKPLVTVG